MAETCEFTMYLNGTMENIENFFEALTHKKNTYIGKGAKANILHVYNDAAVIHGTCKWSIQASLINSALLMKSQIKTYGNPITTASEEILTLSEACKKYHLTIKAYSGGENSNLQEYYSYINL